MRVLFYLLLIYLLIRPRKGLLISKHLSIEVPPRLEILEIHPILIIDIFEQLRRKIVIFLIDSFLSLVGDLRIDADHHPIQKTHDQIIVIPTLPVSKNHTALLQKIEL
jgi:hypothetical protein